jgi:large conductance mechanosensitive channel
MLKEFREFVMRGNVVGMAVGIVVGAAFGAIVKSFVADVLPIKAKRCPHCTSQLAA